MQRNSLFVLLLSPLFILFGQEEPSSGNSVGFLENIHLHLNKTTFLQGERLWLKAYVFDQNTKLPPLETTNLHVGIYKNDGEEIKRKLFYVENGMAQGDFAIDSTLTDNEYTVLAWTNYMRNFKELEPFRQRIKILRDGMEENTGEVEMEISIYPEGGQLIAGAYNNIGILVDNDLGQGVRVDNLELVDETGQVLRRKIATNKLGMGKIGFDVKAKTIYYLQRRGLDGKLVRQRLPEAVSGQFGIHVDNREVDKVRIEMAASKASFEAMDGEVLGLAVYQDDYIGFENFEVNGDKPIIWFDRKQMPYGVVTAVLFDKELRPVSRRMFFNHRKDKPTTSLKIEHCLSEQGDSLQIDLILPKNSEHVSNLSLSALPKSTIANEPDQSMVSSFWVRPYTTKYFQDAYFFEADDRQRRFELDKRLIIEGWGKYNWDSRTWKEIQLEYEMEKGIPILGRVTDAGLKKEQQLLLSTRLSKTLEYVDLNGDASFRHSMPLYEGDSISFSFIGSGGTLRKPNVEWQVQESLSIESTILPWLAKQTLLPQKNGLSEFMPEATLNLDEQIIALDEVTVSEKKSRDNSFQISPFVEGRLIGDEEIKRYPSLVGYIGGLGFSTGNPIRQTRWPRLAVPIFVDGVIASFQEWVGIPLRNVENVVFNKNDVYSPFIAITLKDKFSIAQEPDQFVKYIIEKGYSRPQTYFSPNYPNYNSAVFKNYGALDWRPNVIVVNDIPTSITVPLNRQDGVRLFIEGLVSDGSLVSQQEVIQITVNP